MPELRSIHPGVGLDDVVENTAFTHDWVPERVSETPSTTGEELRLIREVVDPRGCYCHGDFLGYCVTAKKASSVSLPLEAPLILRPLFRAWGH